MEVGYRCRSEMAEMPCATEEDRNHQVVLVETGPHAVISLQGSVVHISLKTDLVHHHLATVNKKNTVVFHKTHLFNRFTVNSTRGQIDTCVKLTTCQVNLCVEMTLVKLTHGQLDRSQLM